MNCPKFPFNWNSILRRLMIRRKNNYIFYTVNLLVHITLLGVKLGWCLYIEAYEVIKLYGIAGGSQMSNKVLAACQHHIDSIIRSIIIWEIQRSNFILYGYFFVHLCVVQIVNWWIELYFRMS